MTILPRRLRHMLEDISPDAPEAPRYTWEDLQPLIEGGYVERIGFTPVITTKGHTALSGAVVQPLEQENKA